MTWKTEVAAFAVTVLAASSWWHMEDPFNRPDQDVAVDHFTLADYEAFERGAGSCDVRLVDGDICLQASPLERALTVGEPLPDHIPALSAEYRILLQTPLKESGLKTVRYGRTLALIETDTRVVRDVLDLTAEDFEMARPVVKVAPKS
ncbi:MAG: hypothetical protein AAFQ85_03560 [Pseudomonadota bacterium]